MPYTNAAVWIDRHEALVVRFNPETHDCARMRAASSAEPAAGRGRAWRRADTKNSACLYSAIARHLDGLGAILVAGGSAHASDQLIARLNGAERDDTSGVTMPSEAELLSHAREWFEGRRTD